MALAIKPEEVYLCALCHYLVHPPASNSATGRPLDPVQSSHRIALFLLKLLKVQPSARFPSLAELCSMLVAQLGTGLGGELVQQLQIILTGLTTPDDLINIMEAVGNLVSPLSASATGTTARIGAVAPSSVLGLFLRRVRASFLLASYSAQAATAATLQLDLQQATAAAAQPAAAGSTAGAGQTASSYQWKGSWREPVGLQQYLETQLRAVSHRGAVCLDERELQDLLHELQLQHTSAAAQGSVQGPTSVLLSKVLQLQLAGAQSEGDYTRALHALHAFIDHAQTPSVSSQSEGDPSSGGYRARHQRALVSLAALHTHFGHTQEALDALSEALRSAQQGNDPGCLLHALAALAHLTASVAPGSPGFPADTVTSLVDGGWAMQVHRLLARCLTRAQELQCPDVATFARLGLARWRMRFTVEAGREESARTGSGGGTTVSSGEHARQGGDWATQSGVAAAKSAPGPIRPALQEVQEACRRVMHTAMVTCLDASSPPGLFGAAAANTAPTAGPAMPHTRAPILPELYGASQIFPTPQAWAGADAVAETTMRHAASSRLLSSAAWFQAGCATLGGVHALSYLLCWGPHSDAVNVELAMAHLVQLAAQTQGTAASQCCCRAVTQALEQRGSRQPRTRALSLALARASHRQACQEGCVQRARWHESHIYDLEDPAGTLDSCARLEGLMARVNTALCAGDLSTAREAAQEGFTQSRLLAHPEYATEFLMLQGRVWLRAQQPAKAQQYLHSCLVHAQMSGDDTSASQCALMLAHCWLVLEPELASRVLGQMQDVLPVLFSQLGPRWRGEACRLCAETVLVAGRTRQADNQDAPRRRAAGRLLSAALSSLEMVGAWNEAAGVAHTAAMAQHQLGEYKERDTMAERVLMLRSRARDAQLGMA